MTQDRLKSSYELAMERFQKKDADAGLVQTPLTDAQKAAIADVRSRYQAKLAELEILHRSHTMATMDPAAREAAADEYRRERERLSAEREKKIGAVRRGGVMNLQQSVEFLVAVQTLVIAISHIAQPRAWVDFFVWLRGKGHAGVFANGFLSLWFGSIIVAFHPVWSGPAMVVTLLGWAQVVKALIAFAAPQVSMRGFQRVSPERSHEFVVAGVALLAISAVCWYVVLAPALS